MKNPPIRFRSTLSFLLILFAIQSARAQAYNTAAGLRAGNLWGLSLQQRIMDRTTLEALIQRPLGDGQLHTGILVERHIPLLVRNLNLYGGVGLHKEWAGSDRDAVTPLPYGISLIGGAEVTLGRFNLSWDLRPMIDLDGPAPGFDSETAISIRYVLWKRKQEKRPAKWKFWKASPEKERIRKKKKRDRQRSRRRR